MKMKKNMMMMVIMMKVVASVFSFLNGGNRTTSRPGAQLMMPFQLIIPAQGLRLAPLAQGHHHSVLIVLLRQVDHDPGLRVQGHHSPKALDS